MESTFLLSILVYVNRVSDRLFQPGNRTMNVLYTVVTCSIRLNFVATNTHCSVVNRVIIVILTGRMIYL